MPRRKATIVTEQDDLQEENLSVQPEEELEETQQTEAEREKEIERRYKEADRYLQAQRRKAEKEMEKARSQIEARREAMAEEYMAQIETLTEKKLEYQRSQEDLAIQRAELEADLSFVKELKERYSRNSEAQVTRLTLEAEAYKTQLEAFSQRIQELVQENISLKERLSDGGQGVLEQKIEALEAELGMTRKKVQAQANLPTQKEIEDLLDQSRELQEVKKALEAEKERRREAQGKLTAYSLSARELENARTQARVLEALNDQLQSRLKAIGEQAQAAQESKFQVLLDIDQEVAKTKEAIGRPFQGSLKELCEYVRLAGANRMGLYYSIETIRVFFASLAASERASRLLILQGLSGTGKSSLPRMVARVLGASCRFVTVQPSWRDNRELLGYDNDFTNRFKETEFTKFLYEASALPNRKSLTLIVLDEMNLARVEYYFADFLSVLEKPDKEEWLIPLVSGYSQLQKEQMPKYLDYSNEAASLCVTPNIWFVGTANNDDSTSLITDKVYDRAQVLDMERRVDPFEAGEEEAISMNAEELTALFHKAEEDQSLRLTREDKQKLEEVDEYLREMEITFGNRILSQMEDFVPVYQACGGTKEEAIDYLLTHKILRKLDERYEPYLKDKLEELELGLGVIYGEGAFPQSLSKIQRLREKMGG